MSTSGRLQPFDLLDFKKFEGPLSVRADVQNDAMWKFAANGWYEFGSRHPGDKLLYDGYRPKGDIKANILDYGDRTDVITTQASLGLQVATESCLAGSRSE